VISKEEATVLVEMLCSLPFPPEKGPARGAVANVLVSMVDTFDHGERMVMRILNSPGYDKFPTPAEIRGVYCSLFPPQDGINGYSQVYPHGDFPDSKPVVAPSLRLPAGHVATADRQLDAGFQRLLAAPKGMPTERDVKLSPAERKRMVEFNRELEAVVTAPEGREGIDEVKLFEVEIDSSEFLRRRRTLQSDFVCLNPGDQTEKRPRPPGSYKPITKADVDEEVRKLRQLKGAL